MFRTELNVWAQGGAHHSSSSMAMSQQEMSIFNYADEGALLVKEKYPSKDILNISPAMGAAHILRYRIIDSSATVAPPARMGMGGDYALYNPETKGLLLRIMKRLHILGFEVYYTRFINYIHD